MGSGGGATSVAGPSLEAGLVAGALQRDSARQALEFSQSSLDRSLNELQNQFAVGQSALEPFQVGSEAALAALQGTLGLAQNFDPTSLSNDLSNVTRSLTQGLPQSGAELEELQARVDQQVTELREGPLKRRSQQSPIFDRALDALGDIGSLTPGKRNRLLGELEKANAFTTKRQPEIGALMDLIGDAPTKREGKLSPNVLNSLEVLKRRIPEEATELRGELDDIIGGFAGLTGEDTDALRNLGGRLSDLQGRLGDFDVVDRQHLNDPENIAARLKETPGFNFRFNQGSEAIARQASSRGLLGSGRFAEELTQFGQEFGANEFQNFQNRLAGLAGMQPALAQAGGAQQLGQSQAGLLSQFGQTAAQTALQSGQGQASAHLASNPQFLQQGGSNLPGLLSGIGQAAGGLSGLAGVFV